MCEKSQLAGIRLHSAVTPRLIILIRVRGFSSIPFTHQGRNGEWNLNASTENKRHDMKWASNDSYHRQILYMWHWDIYSWNAGEEEDRENILKESRAKIRVQWIIFSLIFFFPTDLGTRWYWTHWYQLEVLSPHTYSIVCAQTTHTTYSII